MITEITGPTHTDRLMAALSVAERITSETSSPPSSLRVDTNSDWGNLPGTFEGVIGVLLYFHRSTDAVHRFAEAFGLEVVERPHGDEDLLTYADGDSDGVPFRAWTLLAAEETAEAVSA